MMSYTLVYKPSVARTLAKLDKRVQARLKPKIKALAINPRPHGVVKLQGFKNRYRIRVGDYRVIYEIHDDILRVLVVEVGPRGGIY